MKQLKERITEILEEQNVSQDTIEEVVERLSTLEVTGESPVASSNREKELIRMELMREDDWKKRASLAALLISKDYE
jgi:hypothetical protein